MLLYVTLCICSETTSAQWERITTYPILGPSGSHGGGIRYKDGVLWAGKTKLWKSLDTGKTWNICNLSEYGTIWDIACYDKSTVAVVQFSTSGVAIASISYDAGGTWKQIKSGLTASHNISFWNASNDIVIAEGFPGVFHHTTNGGANWTSQTIQRWMQMFIPTGSSTGILLCGGRLYYTVDHGRTFSASPQRVESDCWSFAIDKCDVNRIYVVNESSYSPTEEEDNASNIFTTNDGGRTWGTLYANSSENLTGAITQGERGIFCQTNSMGVLRSTDRGVSWKNIGGPEGSPDSRMVTAIDDNLLVGVDKAGYIWLTKNSGGDSVKKAPKGEKIAIEPTEVFLSDTISVCRASINRGLKILYSDCILPRIQSIKFEGNANDEYSVISIANDSVIISFDPDSSGLRDAVMIITLDDSSVYTIKLRGAGSGTEGSRQFTVSEDTLFNDINVAMCKDYIDRTIFFTHLGCDEPRIISINVFGYAKDDYSVVSLASDSAIIRFSPISYGLRNAYLQITLDKGEKYQIQLLGTGIAPPDLLTSSQVNIVYVDSLFTCQSADTSFSIYLNACSTHKILSEHITGKAADDFFIIRGVSGQIGNVTHVVIRFAPKYDGKREAIYTVTLEGGIAVSITLTGIGKRSIPLTLAMPIAIATDTLGDDVEVPIHIYGLDTPRPLEFKIHFPENIMYLGCNSTLGKQLDVSGTISSTTSTIRVSADDIVTNGYQFIVHFQLPIDANMTFPITISDIQVTDAISLCEFVSYESSATIAGPLGCGIETLSDYIKYRKIPEFAVTPNPTYSNIRISVGATLENVVISVYDIAGILRRTATVSKLTSIPYELSTDGLEGGIYLVSLQASGLEQNKRFLKLE